MRIVILSSDLENLFNICFDQISSLANNYVIWITWDLRKEKDLACS